MTNQPPNILWLMSDQHNARASGFGGNRVARTPHLDALAAEGTVFTNAYCNNPICSPSRKSFLLSQYPTTHGFYGNLHESKDLPAHYFPWHLKQAGYETALVGKSHTSRFWDEASYDFKRVCGFCDADPNDPYTNHYFADLATKGLADLYEEGNENKPLPEAADGSLPSPLLLKNSLEHFTGQTSLQFLANRNRNKPFFLKMSFQRPHDPITPSPEFFDLYDPQKVTLPHNWGDAANGFPGRPGYIRDAFREEWAKGKTRAHLHSGSGHGLRRALASYYALITSLDGQIGRVIAYLKGTRDWDNTLVVYVSDHGDFAGEHGLMFKTMGIFDSVHRIPWVIKATGSKPVPVSNALVESIDLVPTLCELAGLALPKHGEGTSTVPYLYGSGIGKQAVFCDQMESAAVVTQTHRLVFNFQSNEGELYDRTADPGEMVNLWGHPIHSGLQNNLLSRLFTHRANATVKSGSPEDRLWLENHRDSPVLKLHKFGHVATSLKQGLPPPQTREELVAYWKMAAKQ